MKCVMYGLTAMALLLSGAGLGEVQADNFSFTGNFTQDDNVQLFNFNVGATSTVTLVSYGYAGGTNAAGQVIARGGFDTILALFDSSGNLIDQNDDGGANVPADSVTGQHYDTFLQSTLSAGSYTVAVMEYDNFAKGPTFANGFLEDGQGNFTGPFVDVTGNQRDNHWAFDVLNVSGATEVNGVPEPASLTLAGMGILGLTGFAWRRRKTIGKN